MENAGHAEKTEHAEGNRKLGLSLRVFGFFRVSRVFLSRYRVERINPPSTCNETPVT